MTKIRMLMCAAALLGFSGATLRAHDGKIHKAAIGEAAAVTADGLDLKTKSGVLKVKYSSRTKFERDGKAVGRADVKNGEALGVIGNKLPTGEVMAVEVILGRSVQKELAGRKGAHQH